MSHFAQLDENDIVTRVLVIEQSMIDTGQFGPPSRFVQTSYNTYAGQHSLGGTPLRKNFAAVGYTYDRAHDAFIAPKPYNSWILNGDTGVWEAPIPNPGDGLAYVWSEQNNSWVLAEPNRTTIQEL